MTHPDRFLLAGVMGWPVMHSRSPMLHNYWFKKHGLAGTYVPLAIRPEHLAGALRGLHPLGFAGVNVTIPHKQEAMKIVDEVDALAKSIGAISCVIVKPDGSLAGTNNDSYGFIHALRQEQPGWHRHSRPRARWRNRGVTTRCVYAPAQGGTRDSASSTARFHARSESRRNSGPARALPWEQRHESLEGAAMVVNTTSCGMVGQPALDLELRQAAEERARRRHHLHSARDAVPRRRARPRQPDRQRLRHAAASGQAGVEGVVRH
jgi:shikimate dehydrogenase